eukprot:CAMPEP_0184669822 /NCGR_PEP_ID=MMETSP0308-20130426/79264_1 /TAXON_ID=38269 /ORGANISM="Gloeochaete witrockiana, Strain SAG 46.84" /LENGTH=196 /DNA_ID=CAMNT_0027116277 /DNA_START=29 /DNA_END=619 /DNA_ORIENTATION=-
MLDDIVEDSGILLELLVDCAVTYLNRGHVGTAVSLLEHRALKIVDEHPETHPKTVMHVLDSLGRAYADDGQYDDAINIYARLVSLCTSHLGRSHVNTGLALVDLAVVHAFLRQKEEGSNLFKEGSTFLHELLPHSDPRLAYVYYCEAFILRVCFKKNNETTISAFKKALEVLDLAGTSNHWSKISKGSILQEMALT